VHIGSDVSNILPIAESSSSRACFSLFWLDGTDFLTWNDEQGHLTQERRSDALDLSNLSTVDY